MTTSPGGYSNKNDVNNIIKSCWDVQGTLYFILINRLLCYCFCLCTAKLQVLNDSKMFSSY